MRASTIRRTRTGAQAQTAGKLPPTATEQITKRTSFVWPPHKREGGNSYEQIARGDRCRRPIACARVIVCNYHPMPPHVSSARHPRSRLPPAFRSSPLAPPLPASHGARRDAFPPSAKLPHGLIPIAHLGRGTESSTKSTSGTGSKKLATKNQADMAAKRRGAERVRAAGEGSKRDGERRTRSVLRGGWAPRRRSTDRAATSQRTETKGLTVVKGIGEGAEASA